MDTGLLLVAAFCGIWQFVSTTDFGYTLSDNLRTAGIGRRFIGYHYRTDRTGIINRWFSGTDVPWYYLSRRNGSGLRI